jgi:pimeloyl-ACP methyl ester carboxylesterase
MTERLDLEDSGSRDPVDTGLASNNDIRIRYERSGPTDGVPLLLIMGVGMQMIMWHDDLVRAFTDRAFSVARYDHRDCGESTHLHNAGRPTIMKMLLRPSSAAYTLGDMADDAAAVMDELDWPSAHVVGISMGGMIAQELAIHHPDRLRTLTSMMATPTPRIGRISLRTAARLNRLQDRPVTTKDNAGELMADLFELIGSPGHDLDVEWLRETGRRAFDRGYDQSGRLRHEAALMAGKDRRSALADVRVPTLVLHGEADPVWKVAAGRATAEAIPGARLVTIPGLGHGLLPRSVWPTVVDEIVRLTGV